MAQIDESKPLLIEDFENLTTATVDSVNDTITFGDLKPEEKEPEKTENTENERKAIERERRLIAAHKENTDFDTLVQSLRIEGEVVNKTAEYIIETLLFIDPTEAKKRFTWLDYVGLSGDRLEKFFREKEIKGNMKNLISHIDNKILMLTRYNAVRRLCEAIAKMAPEDVQKAAPGILKDYCGGGEFVVLHSKMQEMLVATVSGNLKWIEFVRDYIFDKPKIDETVVETFKYVKHLLEATEDMSKKGVLSGQEGEKPNTHPILSYRIATIFAIFNISHTDIKIFYRHLRKIMATDK